MAVQRLDNTAVVITDLDGAIAFFTELGLVLDGRAEVVGDWVDRVTGLDGVRSEVAVMRTPDGQGAVELTRFHTPGAVDPGPRAVNALGVGRLMFAVDDLDATLDRLRPLGATPVGEVVTYEDAYRLAYLRGPDGVLIALAEEQG